MTRIHLRLAIAALAVVAGVRWIVNSNPWSGPVLITLSPDHGVHLNDWVSFALWFVAAAVGAPALSALDAGRRALPVRTRR